MSRCLILPVPVVFLLLAFTDLKHQHCYNHRNSESEFTTHHPKLLILAAGKPQGAHTFFWMWKATLPHLLHRVCVLLRLIPKDEVPFVMMRLFFFSET